MSLIFYASLPLEAIALTVLFLNSDVSSSFPRVAFYSRAVLSFTCLVACACYGVVASVALRIAGYGGLSQYTVARAFKWTMWATTGVEFVIQDEHHLRTRPAVFLGNHQTELDVLMLGAVFPPYTSVTSKKSLKYIPFLGWFMALSKTVFIDRGNRETARAAFDGAAKHMVSERQNVFIFPEGTRSYSTQAELLPFKKGAFHLAIQAQVPIVPIVVANYSNVLNIKARIFNAGKIPVKVLPPISTQGMKTEDVDGLMKRTRDAMLEELVKLTEIAKAQRVSLTSEERRNLLDEGRDGSTDSARSTGRDGL